MSWFPDISHFASLESVFKRLDEKLARLEASRPLPVSALDKIRLSLSTEWTYNSNGIEGNSLTLRETHIVLNEGMTVKGKSMREHFETHNHDKAIKLLYKMVDRDRRKALDAYQLLELHALVLQNIEEDQAGRFRSGGVRIVGANFVPPSARKVSDLVDEMFDLIGKKKTGLPLIALATLLHHRLVWIHPFFDGNGRSARLITNLLLIKAGFPPAIILKNDRKKYYAALNAANKGSYVKLCQLFAQALERSLNIYLSVIPDQEEYLPISQIVEEPGIPYGQEYVSLLARQGKIDAHKEGRNWVTTREAVLRYSDARG